MVRIRDLKGSKDAKDYINCIQIVDDYLVAGGKGSN
jgi:hypothetical protein